MVMKAYFILGRRPDKRQPAYTTKLDANADAKADAKAVVTDISRDSSKSAGAQMRSAQAHSFWSMYYPLAARIRPTRYFTVTDLAGAVATILATGVVILSLVMVTTDLPGDGVRQVLVSGHFGHVQGLSLKVLGHTDVYAFLGVPYAHPPLGERRFRRTFLEYDFGQGSVIDATVAKPACEQRALDDDPLSTVSEDCLHLNIWTTSRECLSPQCANKSVLVILHDGSFQTGGNRDPLYDGKYLCGLGDVVVVVPNYRLGALGFLNNGSAAAPGNVGLYDQLLALEWTRHNIGRFGGNSSNLVLVGYGSGAAAAGYLLASQAAGAHEAGVVPRRVILMSGSPLTRYPDNTETAGRRVIEQAKRMRCLNSGEPDFKCMLEASASLIVQTAAPPLFFPSFTGLIPFPPREMLQNEENRIAGIEILLGHMDSEMVHAVQTGADNVASSSNETVAAVELFRSLGLNISTVDAIIERYKKRKRVLRHRTRLVQKYSWETTEVLHQMLEDLLVACPVREFSQILDSTGENRIFRYLISSKATGPVVKAGDMLRLLFGKPFLRPLEHDSMRPASELVINLWTSFARTGSIPDINGFTLGRFTFRIGRARKKNDDSLDSRKEYCEFLKEVDVQ
ncbi:cholinesterase-like [Dermacentor variabilis]|uniref:cholinesterase-like n=1 Tax=Dermacentor variabilis TaxID=34621 RepID=UPI003F5B4380